MEVYRLVGGTYELLSLENNRVWLPEIGLGFGYEQGEHIGWNREWLYWYDESGDRYLTGEERAIKAEIMATQQSLIAQQERQQKLKERQQKLQERQQKEKLANYLRSMGIDPDEI